MIDSKTFCNELFRLKITIKRIVKNLKMVEKLVKTKTIERN